MFVYVIYIAAIAAILLILVLAIFYVMKSKKGDNIEFDLNLLKLTLHFKSSPMNEENSLDVKKNDIENKNTS